MRGASTKTTLTSYILSNSFNPVAKTFLTKMLSAIVQEEYSRAPRRPSATMIQLIAEGSDGDIRTAINTLQFVTLQCDNSCAGLWEVTTGGGPVKKRRGKMGETVAVASDLPFLSCKDTRFDLFHALGKVLYAKRRPDASPGQSVSLPAHLRHFERPHALQTPIDEVVQGLPIAESLYLLYLHANYTTFHADIDDALLLSADGFSLADTLPRQYYGKFVAASSVAMSVDCAPSASGSTRIFQSMCKPKFFDCLRKRKELAGTGDGLFESWRQTYCSGARGGLTTVFDARMSVSRRSDGDMHIF